MLYCFLGGLGYVFGPIVGTFVLFLSFEMLQGLNEYQPLVYSILMIGLMLWLPNGLLSLGEGSRRKAETAVAQASAERQA
jgi:branched-chain amino acid transport system permease protein